MATASTGGTDRARQEVVMIHLMLVVLMGTLYSVLHVTIQATMDLLLRSREELAQQSGTEASDGKHACC